MGVAARSGIEQTAANLVTSILRNPSGTRASEVISRVKGADVLVKHRDRCRSFEASDPETEWTADDL
jgi:hypothetical protein